MFYEHTMTSIKEFLELVGNILGNTFWNSVGGAYYFRFVFFENLFCTLWKTYSGSNAQGFWNGKSIVFMLWCLCHPERMKNLYSKKRNME